MIKPAYSVSFLLSINTFVWQNVLYFPNVLRTYTNGRLGSIPVQSFEVNGGKGDIGTSFSPSTSAFPCQYPSTNAPYLSPFTRHSYHKDKWVQHGKLQKAIPFQKEDGWAENYFHFSDVIPNTLTALLSSSSYSKQPTCHHFTCFSSQRPILLPTYFYR